MNQERFDKLAAAYRKRVALGLTATQVDRRVFEFRQHLGAGQYARINPQQLQAVADDAGVTSRPGEPFLKALDRYLERMI